MSVNNISILKENISNLLKNFCDLNGFFLIEKIKIEKTISEKFGHLSTNLALEIASKYSKDALEIAKKIVLKAKKIEKIEKIEISNSGFLNFYFTSEFINENLKLLLSKGAEIAKWDSNNKQYHIEIVSANPNGNLHIGHVRNAVVGDTISNLLKLTGSKVITSYLINDSGEQIKKTVLSVFEKYKSLLYATSPSKEKECEYKNYEIEECARSLINLYGTKLAIQNNLKDSQMYEKMHDFVVNYFVERIKKDLKKLNIFVDLWESEKKITSKTPIKIFLSKIEKHIYVKDDAIWFKNSDFLQGEKDNVIVKKNGDLTYFGQDIIYHMHKLSFLNKEGKIINIFACDHSSHITRLQSFFKAVKKDETKLMFITTQLSKLVKDNKKVIFSKRKNNLVNVNELCECLSYEEIRWFFVSKDVSIELNIDIEKLKNKKYNNHVYYVLYAYSRISQILEKANINEDEYQKIKNKFTYENSIFTSLEKEIINLIIFYEETIFFAAKTFKPFYICNYLVNLSKNFHMFYEKCKILNNEDEKIKNNRIILCYLIKNILKKSLTILQINPKNKI